MVSASVSPSVERKATRNNRWLYRPSRGWVSWLSGYTWLILVDSLGTPGTRCHNGCILSRWKQPQAWKVSQSAVDGDKTMGGLSLVVAVKMLVDDS